MHFEVLSACLWVNRLSPDPGLSRPSLYSICLCALAAGIDKEKKKTPYELKITPCPPPPSHLGLMTVVRGCCLLVRVLYEWSHSQFSLPIILSVRFRHRNSFYILSTIAKRNGQGITPFELLNEFVVPRNAFNLY